MCEAVIQLSNNLTAIVNPEDFERLSRVHWLTEFHHGRWRVRTRNGVSMSRYVLNLLGDSRIIDHINGNGLDNRRCNLRVCTRRQNQMNVRKSVFPKSSKYKGVSWRKGRGKWTAYVHLNKTKINLGVFFLEKDAAIAYNEAAKKLYGEFACLNNILEEASNE